MLWDLQGYFKGMRDFLEERRYELSLKGDNYGTSLNGLRIREE